MKQRYTLALVLLALAVPFAYAQEEVSEIPITVGAVESVIIGIGVAGGVTSAYLGMSKAKNEATDANPYVFNKEKFINRVVLAVLTSVGLAITASVGMLELNLVTMYMVFMASLGTAYTISTAKKN